MRWRCRDSAIELLFHQPFFQLDDNHTSANELVTEQKTKKRNRHGPGATRSVGMSTSDAAPISGSRHAIESARKSTYDVAPKVGTASRHTIVGGAEEPKRQIKPSQKLIESRQNVIGRHGVEPRSRHHP